MLGTVLMKEKRPLPTAEAEVQPTPEELMHAIAVRRDRTAFVELYRQLGPRVKAFLMRQGADKESAEDVTQEVMLTVWRRAEQYDRSKAAVSTWVFTIARNRRIDSLRRTRRPEIDPEDPALLPEPARAADDVVDLAEQGRLLHAAVAELPEEQERLLRMAYFEDKSHSMIAEELELPLGTVKSRLRLAMAKLRHALETPA
ncbi:MAG: sigma-70 family RNA polymerase sigma factor [Pseudomonadota bacterium]